MCTIYCHYVKLPYKPVLLFLLLWVLLGIKLKLSGLTESSFLHWAVEQPFFLVFDAKARSLWLLGSCDTLMTCTNAVKVTFSTCSLCGVLAGNQCLTVFKSKTAKALSCLTLLRWLQRVLFPSSRLLLYCLVEWKTCRLSFFLSEMRFNCVALAGL